MIVRAKNILASQSPSTFLSFNQDIGVGTLQVKNINAAQSSWAMQIGNTGEANAEIVISGTAVPAGTSIVTTANTRFSHAADTPVYFIKYDQIVFERSTAGTMGTAAPITNGTLTIRPDSLYTQFDDTSGSASYGYRAYFQNSVSLSVTTESDWLTSTGFAFSSLAKMRQRVRTKLVNSTYIPNDSDIDDWLNEWLETMVNTAIDVDEGYQMGTTSVAYASGVELGTITATDFKQDHRVWYADGSGTYQATKMNSNRYQPSQVFNSTYPYFYYEGDNIVGRKPSDVGPGTFVFEYYKLQPVLVNDTDQIPLNMQAYTKSFVNYGVGQALFRDQKVEEAQMKIQEAMGDKELFKKEITPRSKAGAEYIDIVEDMGQNNEIWF